MKTIYNFLKRTLSYNKFVYNFFKKFYIKYKNNVYFIPANKKDIDSIIDYKKIYNLNLSNFNKLKDNNEFFLIVKKNRLKDLNRERLKELINIIRNDTVDVAYDGFCPNHTEICSRKILEYYADKFNLEDYPHNFFYIKNNFSIKNIGPSHRSFNFNGSFILPSGGKTIGDGGDVSFRLNFIPDLKNKSFLDIGSEEGYAVLDAIKKGAKFAKGLNIVEAKEYDFFPDHSRPAGITTRERSEVEKTQNFLKKEYGLDNNDKIKFEYNNIYNLKDEKFDFVFCFGVLYHLKNPYKALENLFNITNETLIIETQGIKNSNYLNAKIDPSDGFIRHSSNSLKFLLEKVGFDKVKILVDAHHSSMEITNIVLKAEKANI